jgi:hypothetical protein
LALAGFHSLASWHWIAKLANFDGEVHKRHRQPLGTSGRSRLLAGDCPIIAGAALSAAPDVRVG